MANGYGIDLGSLRTVICSGKSVVLDEHSAISYQTNTGELIAAGTDAYKMIGRTPDSVTAVRPIIEGVIADYDMAQNMLTAFISEVAGNNLLKARLMVAVPSGITSMQRRSLINACIEAGARDVCTIEGPVAAAIGLGMDFTTPKGSVIVDIGAGTTDIATLSLGGLVKSESIGIAGDYFNREIEKYIKFEHNIVVGPHTVEQIKAQIGCVKPRPLELTLTAKGQHQFTGMPQTFEINTSEMITALYDAAQNICKSIQSVIEKSPPEVVGDIERDGITLIGGGSCLYGLSEFISEYTGVRVNSVENPKTCVALGTATALKNFDLLKNGDYKFSSMEEYID
ncbi:MAG: rod shape-determining protein [Acutalibacteraceae bacterium]|nr:rod shape-determining protein [Acutalibacteraceae bacterium]